MSCQNRNVGSYNLDSVLNDKLLEEYKNNTLSKQFKKDKSEVDSLKTLLNTYRDSLKHNLIDKKESFENYNTVKKNLLSKEQSLKRKLSEIEFNIQDSIYQKISLAVKNVGENEGLDIILPQNKYSLNYIATKVEVTDFIKQELKKLVK